MPVSTTPIPDLYLHQIGSESTWGTPVAQTARLGLVEELEFSPELEAMNLADRRASLAPGYVAALLKSSGTAKMKGICTYQDMPYWQDALFGIATPGGANPYTRDYIGALGTIPTRRIFTLVKGQSAPFSHIYGLNGAVLSEMSIKIETGQPWMYDLSFIGKNYTTDTIDSLSDRTQAPILSTETSLFIDAVGGTIGTTAVTSLWMSAEINIKSNAETHFGIGALAPTGFHESKWEATMKLTLEVDTTTKAMLDSIIGSSLLQKQIRISATTGASAICRFDMGGSFLSAPKITTDSDGVSTFEFEFTSIYNSALGNFVKSHTTNAVSALP